MNYREMHDLFKKALSELKEEWSENRDIQSKYAKIIDSETKNVDRINKLPLERILSSAYHGKLDDAFIDDLTVLFDVPRSRVESVIESLKETRSKSQNDLAKKLEELNETSSSLLLLKSLRRDRERAADRDNANYQPLQEIKNLIEHTSDDFNITIDTFRGADQYGLMSRLFNSDKRQISRVAVTIVQKVEPLLKVLATRDFPELAEAMNVEHLKEKINFSDNPTYVHELIIKELEDIDTRNVEFKEFRSNIQATSTKEERLKTEAERIQLKVNKLDEDDIANRSITSLIETEYMKANGKEKLYIRLKIGSSLAEKKRSEHIINAARKIIDGLKSQETNIERAINQIDAPMSKLAKAKSKSGNKRANFDDREFSATVSKSINSFKRTNAWANRETGRLTTGSYYDYSTINSHNMLLWYILSDDTPDNMARVVLTEEMGAIQDFVKNYAIQNPDVDIKGFDSSMIDIEVGDHGIIDMRESGFMNIDHISPDRISMPDIGSIEVPTFEVPTVDIPSSDYSTPTPTYGGSGFGGGGGFGDGGGGGGGSDSGGGGCD